MHHIRYYHAGKKWKFFHANLGGPSKKTFLAEMYAEMFVNV